MCEHTKEIVEFCKQEVIALFSIIPRYLHQTISITRLSASCSNQRHRFPQHKDTKWGLVDFTHKAVVNIDGLFLLAVLTCGFLVNDDLLN